MTIFIFVGSLLGSMAIGIPIAYSLLLSGLALMVHLDAFDAQILAQNTINGADSFPLLAVPFFMLAGEVMNACASREVPKQRGPSGSQTKDNQQGIGSGP